MGTPGGQYDIKTVSRKSLVPNIYETLDDFEQANSVNLKTGVKTPKTREDFNQMDKNDLIDYIMEGKK